MKKRYVKHTPVIKLLLQFKTNLELFVNIYILIQNKNNHNISLLTFNVTILLLKSYKYDQIFTHRLTFT